jgi:hypothetical protein
MTDTARSANHSTRDDEIADDETAQVDEVMQRLGDWRARIDELRVQVDLAKLDMRDEAAKQLDLARNVNAAAASKLRVAYHDAVANAEGLRHGIHEFLNDLNEAFDAVQGVIAQS